MPGRRSGWVWGSRAAAVIVVLGLACYLFAIGLDRAAALAGVLGLLVAVITLIAPYVLPPHEFSARKQPPQVPEPSDSAQQSVTNSVVGGQLLQAKNVKAVHFTDGGDAARPSAAKPAVSNPAEAPGGQHVDGVWVGGNLTQVDGTDGDVILG